MVDQMNSKRRSNSERLLYIAALLVWIISGVTMLFSLNVIDMIVNNELYDFGLQLSADWLMPYWTYMRLNYALLGISLVLSFLALAVGLSRRNEQLQENVITDPQKHQPITQRNTLRQKERNLPQADGIIMISCSACGKEFSRPMVSLSFEEGKNRLVNVCPYCNHILEDEDEQPQKVNV